MNSGEKDIYGRIIYLGPRARYIIGPSGTKIYKFVKASAPLVPNKRNSAARTIQKAARGHLQKKSAFMYTLGHNTHIRSLIGNFPRKAGKNLLYKKAELYRKHLFDAMRPIKSGEKIYRGISGKNAEKFKERMSKGNMNFNTSTFSSFTRKYTKAIEFAKGSKIVLVLKPYGGLPVVNYTNKTRGLRSKFMNEDEVLLPPGKFKIIGTKPDGYLIKYQVEFKPVERLPDIKPEVLPRIPLIHNLDNAGAKVINEHNKNWRAVRMGKKISPSVHSNNNKSNNNNSNNNKSNNNKSNNNNSNNNNIPSNFTKKEIELYKNYKANYMANLGNANKAKQRAIANVMAMKKLFGKV